MHTSPSMRRAIAIATAIRTLVAEKLGDMDGELFDRFPRDMDTMLEFGLEVPLVFQTELTLQSSMDYLCTLYGDTFIGHTVGLGTGTGTGTDTGTGTGIRPSPDRPVYGLFYAGPPAPVVFVRDGLSSRVRRYVLAHELGHYLADVLLVKRLWLASFPALEAAVHDAFSWGSIDPQLELRALLGGLPMRPRQIMERGKQASSEVAEREIQADLIARELLAPWAEAAHIFRRNLALERVERRRVVISELVENFGLPMKVAAYYCGDLELYLLPRRDALGRLFGPLVQSEGRKAEGRPPDLPG